MEAKPIMGIGCDFFTRFWTNVLEKLECFALPTSGKLDK
jgi:hypothetical protein